MKGKYPQIEAKMQKTVEALIAELATIRAGRANPAVLAKIMVEYYGAETPLPQLAAISTPDARTLVVTPWDAGALKAAEKAIQQSDLGINPVNDGKALRLGFPPLTEERRRDLAKSVKKFAEDSKVSIRNTRRDELEKAKGDKKKSIITEDDLKIIEKDLQELCDKYIKEIDKVAADKEKELMEV
ncbi:MAG: ribosome recycling factor [Clostridia bacterium]|nr:ribosome recycling factor [Clostridia bacterium]